MSAMDEFTELKKIKDRLLKYSWSAEGNIINGLRLFYDDGRRTNEYSISTQEKEVLSDAMQYVERISGNISYNPHKIVADGIRQVLMHYCSCRLKKLAEQAKQEAEAVLAFVPKD